MFTIFISVVAFSVLIFALVPGADADSDDFDGSSSDAGYASGSGRSSFLNDDSDSSMHHGASSSWHDSGPSFNIDGTPMMGSMDINGNPYGVTESSWSSDSWSSSSSIGGHDW